MSSGSSRSPPAASPADARGSTRLIFRCGGFRSSRLRGPIVSSEQVEEFGAFTVDGQEVRLPVRTKILQMALVHEPGYGKAARGLPGIGAASELAGPLRTLWSVEWGYGFSAKQQNGKAGTQSWWITGYRVF